jgi:hypothetical protein
MDQANVIRLNQAAINAIRATGARAQYIFVEGNQWSGAWSWADVNDSMKQLTDPEDKLVFEMHQYLDSDSSGTNQNCVSTTIGEERVRSATQWLRSNGKKGIIGEFAGANNAVCQQAVRGLLAYLAANSDVWMGALWWAAGPWWATYMFSIEVYTRRYLRVKDSPANLLIAPKRPGLLAVHVHPRTVLQSWPGDDHHNSHHHNDSHHHDHSHHHDNSHHHDHSHHDHSYYDVRRSQSPVLTTKGIKLIQTKYYAVDVDNPDNKDDHNQRYSYSNC